MAKVIYKKKGTLITIEDVIHVNMMGYVIKRVDEVTYNKYVNDPLFELVNGCDSEEDDDIII